MNLLSLWQASISAGIFADRDAYRDLSSGFRGDRAKLDATEITIVVVAIIAALAMFWVLSRLASWREGRGPYHNPQQLFKRLCTAHGLGRKERQSLVQLSRTAQLPLPSMAFFRPDIFDNVAAGTITKLRTSELDLLHAKLFGKLGA